MTTSGDDGAGSGDLDVVTGAFSYSGAAIARELACSHVSGRLLNIKRGTPCHCSWFPR
jgi:hypothetical protein